MNITRYETVFVHYLQLDGVNISKSAIFTNVIFLFMIIYIENMKTIT